MTISNQTINPPELKAEKISDHTFSSVWQNQIENAMPKFTKLHEVSKNLFQIFEDLDITQEVQEVRTFQSWVGFRVLFKKSVFGSNMADITKYIHIDWIDVKDGFLCMTFTSDSLRKSYIEN